MKLYLLLKIKKSKKKNFKRNILKLNKLVLKTENKELHLVLQAAAAKLAAAKEAGDLAAEVEANKEIARLGYEEARLNEAKAAYEEMAKAEPKNQRKYLKYHLNKQLHLIQKQRLGELKTSGLVQIQL